MPGNFHESFEAARQTAVRALHGTGVLRRCASLRLCVPVTIRQRRGWLAVAVAILSISLLAPHLLKPLNILWFKFGLLLHPIVNPFMMFALFILVYVPAGFLVRIWSDPLRLRRNREAANYWIERKSAGLAIGSMTNEF